MKIAFTADLPEYDAELDILRARVHRADALETFDILAAFSERRYDIADVTMSDVGDQPPAYPAEVLVAYMRAFDAAFKAKYNQSPADVSIASFDVETE